MDAGNRFSIGHAHAESPARHNVALTCEDAMNFKIVSRRNGWITVVWSDGSVTRHSIG
jgi:hypothetical protein